MQAERRLIEAGHGPAPASTAVPWRRILRQPDSLVSLVMYFCYNFNLNIYIDWFPTYLQDLAAFSLAQMGFYASLPLLAGTVGDLAGGWFSDLVLKRTGNVKRSRRVVAITGISAVHDRNDTGDFRARPEA